MFVLLVLLLRPDVTAPASPEEAVVAIEGAGCSGTVVLSPHLVLTAKHCVQAPGASGPVEAGRLAVLVGQDPRAPRARVPVARVLAWPGRYSADLRGSLAGRDLALLVLAAPAPVEPAGLALAAGARGVAVGYRDFGRRAARPGRILVADARRIVTAPVTCAGDSGGPLLDERGRVVGVASLRAPGPCGRGPSLFTPIGAFFAP